MTALETLNKLIENGYCGKDLNCWSSFYEWKKSHNSLLIELGIKITDGATRFCIVSDSYDWIIKFDKPYMSKDEEMNEEFCAKEARLYNEAKKYGLDKFLAPVSFLVNMNGIDFYIGKKAEIDENKIENKCYDYVSSYLERNEYDSEDAYDMAVSDEVYDLEPKERIYGILGDSDETYKLVKFFEENKVNDLHDGNWGIINNQFIVIDYAGF